MPSLYSVIATIVFFLMPAPTTLYDANLSAVVTLPAGYFVMQADGDAPDGYISVIYDDLNGFVKVAAVQAVDYTPVTKYEKTAMFRCNNDGQPVNLRAAPKRSADIIKVMDNDAKGRLYGETRGDALITNGDTLWYYVNIDGVRGYCYYSHVSVDDIPPNIIEKEDPPDPSTPTGGTPEQKTDAAPVPTAAVIVLIVALCIPVPFIMFFMFRKPNKPNV